MVYSDSSGKLGLVEDIDFICGTDSTSYPLTDKARNCNRHYYVAVSDILRASGRVQFDDSNLTTIPASTVDLVAGQRQYSLPTNLLNISAVEILGTDGNYVRITEIDKQDLTRSITDYEDTDGTPRQYDVIGDQIYLYPAPASGSVTLTAGMKVHYTREVDHFASNDTSQEPGFAEPYHRIISLGAAYDWLLVNGTPEKRNDILAEYQALRAECRRFYAQKNQDIQVKFRPAHRTENYI